MTPGRTEPRTLVIGVGNRDRGDDAVGPSVIDALRSYNADELETIVIEGDLSDLALRWTADQAVVVVDAVRSGRQPGTIVAIDGLSRAPSAGGHPISSHGVGLFEAIELARILNRLPQSLVIFGVEACSFDHFAPLSEPVAAAVPQLTEQVLERAGVATS